MLRTWKVLVPLMSQPGHPEGAEPAAAERWTGFVTGGISPFGQRKRMRTFLDASAGRHSTIWVSGGRRGLQVELDPADLARALEARSVEALAR